jgi:hypothetical protein
LAEAAARSDESVALADRLGDPLDRGQSYTFAGLVDLLRCERADGGSDGRPHDRRDARPGAPGLDDAERRLVAAASLSGETRDLFCLALAVAGLAEVARRREDWGRSVTLWTWLGQMGEAAGLPLPPVDRARRAQALALGRGALGEAAFEAAGRRGRELSPGRLVAYAVQTVR